MVNYFSVQRSRHVPVNTCTPVGTFLMGNLSERIVSDSKQNVCSPLLLVETGCCSHVTCILQFFLYRNFNQLTFDGEFKAAMGLFDGVQKREIRRQYHQVEFVLMLVRHNNVEVQPCTVVDDEYLLSWWY